MKEEALDHSAVLDSVVKFYLESHDFNGYPVYKLKEEYSLSDLEARQLMEDLVSSGAVDVVFTGNPHIKPFNSPDIDAQLAGLKSLEFSEHFCLYPRPATLTGLPEVSQYNDRPYTLLLARGEGQLEFRTFDLSVLEHYRNDPRYMYETDSIHGNISVRDAFYQSNSMVERDQVILQTFGFAYDAEMNRAVAVYLRYLSGLSPEHQHLWRAKELAGNFKIHPDYFRSTILGEWGTRIPIFDAFIEELALINKMTELMKMPPMFLQTYSEQRPREFAFLLRPTLAEFNRFVLLLDQLLSDNLNKQFFASASIPLEDEETRSDGKIIIRARGTIALLEAWMGRYFHPVDPEPIEKIFTTFRKVRKLRQQPAHKINEDVFDQQHFKNQRQLVIEAYDAVRYIRQALANHPLVKRTPPKISEELFDGKIWDI
jgi:hypothetical protein